MNTKLPLAHSLTAGSFDHAVSHLRVLETHISWIVLTGCYAYKIKKPVRYPFLDASTLERRRMLCEEELRLNQRLAPELYVDAVRIGVGVDGQPRIGGSGTTVEYAVRMHEFEPSQELSALLQAGEVSEHDVAELAATLAGFHGRASVAGPDSPYGAFAAVREEVLSNLDVLEEHLRIAAEAHAFQGPARWTRASLERLEPVIARRKREGSIRECHGDLHARNVVRWQGRWTPFDCLEFDPALRWIDVMSDLAFLFMDLAARRGDLAFAFLGRYLEETGDYGGLQVLPFYAVYRALVRAKVDALAAESAGSEAARPLHARLVDRLDVAARFMEPRRPTLILMHGVTACGKSWLSERLIAVLRAVRVRSDLERKRMSGLPPLVQRPSAVGEGPYAPELLQQTYERVFHCAAAALKAGFNVIADATFLSAANRDMFRTLALELGCDFLIVSCRTDRATLSARVEARARSAKDPSEATQDVLEHQLATEQPLTAHELEACVVVDTSWLTSADAGIAEVRARLHPSAFD